MCVWVDWSRAELSVCQRRFTKERSQEQKIQHFCMFEIPKPWMWIFYTHSGWNKVLATVQIPHINTYTTLFEIMLSLFCEILLFFIQLDFGIQNFASSESNSFEFASSETVNLQFFSFNQQLNGIYFSLDSLVFAQEVVEIPHFANRMNIFICNLWLCRTFARKRIKDKIRIEIRWNICQRHTYIKIWVRTG